MSECLIQRVKNALMISWTANKLKCSLFALSLSFLLILGYFQIHDEPERVERYFVVNETELPATPTAVTESSSEIVAPPPQKVEPQQIQIQIHSVRYSRYKSVVKVQTNPSNCELFCCFLNCPDWPPEESLQPTKPNFEVAEPGRSEITIYARKRDLRAKATVVVFNEQDPNLEEQEEDSDAEESFFSAWFKSLVKFESKKDKFESEKAFLEKFNRLDFEWSNLRPVTERESAALEGIFKRPPLEDPLAPLPLISGFSEPMTIPMDDTSSCKVLPLYNRQTLVPKLIPLEKRLQQRELLSNFRRDVSVAPAAKDRFEAALDRARRLKRGNAPNIVVLEVDGLGHLDLQELMPRTYELLQMLNQEPGASHKVFSLRKHHAFREYTDPNILAWMAGTLVARRPDKVCPKGPGFFNCLDDLYSLPGQCAGEVCYSYDHLTGLFDEDGATKKKEKFECPLCLPNIAKNRGYLTAWSSYQGRYMFRTLKVLGMMEADAPMDMMHLQSGMNTSLALDVAFGFLNMHADVPKLVLSHVDDHHSEDMLGASRIDEDAFFYIRRILAHHPNTVVLFGGDHGSPIHRNFLSSRHSHVVPSSIFPSFNILLPTAFLRQYPEAAAALKANQARLTTHLDVYATLRHLIIDFPAPPTDLPPKSFSLLENAVPGDRSCADAGLMSAVEGDIDICICSCGEGRAPRSPSKREKFCDKYSKTVMMLK